ncbi:transmembrane protein 170A [Phymastichus coffea]|uniref:transmembrane protein 170A n=1 Tax=Phymastichus coffea TaxID=108790 RepID=UPI00273B057C|nr:transmembrane protein 170A [Phymastichus coffea]XP_058807683.1 transmembrane protein 170A [Phymastichus coffea]
MSNANQEVTSVVASAPDKPGIFNTPLTSFAEMWYQIFLWALFSSIFVHTIAAAICFATLRKHKYGKFFPVLILVMGVLMPLTSGVVSSAAIAFVYGSAEYQMTSLYALLWGVGQTVLAACVGFTRILATL